MQLLKKIDTTMLVATVFAMVIMGVIIIMVNHILDQVKV